jgi:CheY-like chemotaxis protein
LRPEQKRPLGFVHSAPRVNRWPESGDGNRNFNLVKCANPVVLVVEDEPVLMIYAVGIVEDAGFEAVEANSADEALEILESRFDIRIVFTDIEMPGSMDGMRLAALIRGRWPPIELILTSGRTKIRDEDIPDRGRFFAKPYRPAEIAEALHQLAS